MVEDHSVILAEGNLLWAPVVVVVVVVLVVVVVVAFLPGHLVSVEAKAAAL